MLFVPVEAGGDHPVDAEAGHNPAGGRKHDPGKLGGRRCGVTRCGEA